MRAVDHHTRPHIRESSVWLPLQTRSPWPLPSRGDPRLQTAAQVPGVHASPTTWRRPIRRRGRAPLRLKQRGFYKARATRTGFELAMHVGAVAGPAFAAASPRFLERQAVGGDGGSLIGRPPCSGSPPGCCAPLLSAPQLSWQPQVAGAPPWCYDGQPGLPERTRDPNGWGATATPTNSLMTSDTQRSHDGRPRSVVDATATGCAYAIPAVSQRSSASTPATCSAIPPFSTLAGPLVPDSEQLPSVAQPQDGRCSRVALSAWCSWARFPLRLVVVLIHVSPGW